MALFWLINPTTVSGSQMLPGEPVNDATDDVAAIASAGGFLFPQGNAVVDAAAAHAQNAHTNRGANEVELGLIMSTAVDSVQGTSSPLALTSAAPADVTKAAAAAGVATTAARADHKHDVSTAAPSTLGTANAEGTASSLARADHVHDHGSQTSGTLHALAIADGANGFLSGADKTKLNNLPGILQTGTVTLVAGTFTLSTGIVISASSKVLVSLNTPAGVPQGVNYKVPDASLVVGASGVGAFTVTATDSAGALVATDSSTINYLIVR
jgi:hypothetical protein